MPALQPNRKKAADIVSWMAFVVILLLGEAVTVYQAANDWSPATATKYLLQGGLVFVGAFIVSAIAQRVIVAQYALKAGPFEVQAIEDAAEEAGAASEDLIAQLEPAMQLIRAQLVALNGDVAQIRGDMLSLAHDEDIDRLSDAVYDTITGVTELARRVAGVEETLGNR